MCFEQHNALTTSANDLGTAAPMGRVVHQPRDPHSLLDLSPGPDWRPVRWSTAVAPHSPSTLPNDVGASSVTRSAPGGDVGQHKGTIL